MSIGSDRELPRVCAFHPTPQNGVGLLVQGLPGPDVQLAGADHVASSCIRTTSLTHPPGGNGLEGPA